MRPGTDLPRSRGAQAAPGVCPGRSEPPACHPGHLPGHGPGPGAMIGGRDSSGAGRSSESWRPRRCHALRGYASLCWPASVPAVRSRVVWGRQGDWLSGRAPRSHRGGHWFDPSIAHQLRIWRKARSEDFPDRPHPPRGWGLPVPGPVFSTRMISPVPSALQLRRMTPPRVVKPPQSPARSPVSTAAGFQLSVPRVAARPGMEHRNGSGQPTVPSAEGDPAGRRHRSQAVPGSRALAAAYAARTGLAAIFSALSLMAY